MNTTYTLIKNPDGSFFLHGERCDSVLTKHWVFLEDGNSYTLIGATFGQEYGYPTLTFDEVVAREIGYVDIEKIAWDFMMSIHPSEKRDNEYALYKNIYNKFLNDNNDKAYTKEELIAFGKHCFYKGFEKSEKDDGNSFESWREEAGNLIEQYATPKTQWQVEITNNTDNSITVNKIV